MSKVEELLEEIVEERTAKPLRNLTKSKQYKEMYNEFSKLYDELCNKNNCRQQLEKIYALLNHMLTLKVNKAYKTGFVDGITTRENYYQK